MQRPESKLVLGREKPRVNQFSCIHTELAYYSKILYRMVHHQSRRYIPNRNKTSNDRYSSYINGKFNSRNCCTRNFCKIPEPRNILNSENIGLRAYSTRKSYLIHSFINHSTTLRVFYFLFSIYDISCLIYFTNFF